MSAGYFNQRRLVKRFICYLKGRYTARDNYSHELSCEDISSKGARVLTLQPLAINSQLEFNITAKDMSPIPLSGKVCWCKQATHGFRAGIAFERDLTFDVKALT